MLKFITATSIHGSTTANINPPRRRPMKTICSFQSGNGCVFIQKENGDIRDLTNEEFEAFLALVKFVQKPPEKPAAPAPKE